MDLQDVIVDRSVSRVICTQGDLRITAKGSLASTRALVGNALVEGSVEGSLIARDCIQVKSVGVIRGILHARQIEFAKKSRVKLLNSTHASTVEIHGDVEGEIHATGSVIVHKRGRLAGRVFARGFRVDKGGEFHGSLQIGGVIPPERPNDLFESAEKKPERINTQATFVERPA